MNGSKGGRVGRQNLLRKEHSMTFPTARQTAEIDEFLEELKTPPKPATTAGRLIVASTLPPAVSAPGIEPARFRARCSRRLHPSAAVSTPNSSFITATAYARPVVG